MTAERFTFTPVPGQGQTGDRHRVPPAERRHEPRVQDRRVRRERDHSEARPRRGHVDLPRRHARPIHLRMLEDVRRGAQLHARRDHRRRPGAAVSDAPDRIGRRSCTSRRFGSRSPARRSGRCRAIRCRESPAASSRSSGWASRISRKSRRQKRALARRSTARAALSAIACRRLAARAWSPRSGRRAATSAASSSSSSPTSGSLFQIFSIPTHTCQPIIPPEANVISRRVPIPLFGAGLVEAIPDETLLALDDAGDRDRDGISGRAAVITDIATGRRRVGRFGWKAQQATLLAFGGRRLPERDGDYERSLSGRARIRHYAGADEAVRPDPRSGRPAGSANTAARASTISKRS